MKWLLSFLMLSGLMGVWPLSGCGLGDGKGWTRVAADAKVHWSQEGRLQNDGSFKTSKSYFVAFDTVEVGVQSIAFESVAEEVDGAFDPSNPPPGYSLCHNGHCHNEADELIDYEDILLEMGAASGTSKLITQMVSQPVFLDTTKEATITALTLGSCDDGRRVCEIGPDNLRSVVVNVSMLRLKMRVYHEDKLPADGVDVEVQKAAPVELEKFYPTSLGSDAQQVLRLSVELQLRAAIWDAVEFSDFVVDGEVQVSALSEQLVRALKHNAVLEIETTTIN